MRIINCHTYEAMSRKAADILAAQGLDAEAQAILSDRLAFALHP